MEETTIKIEMQSELQSQIFELKGEIAEWIKTHLDEGKEFKIFFPNYEI